MSFWGYRSYVPVAKRRANALKEVEKLKKKGRIVSPVVVEGRKIAKSFWGKAWCDNLERYSDFANRLPRGRTYVNNGSVVDLQISRGKVEALVSGSEIYTVKIDIAVAAPARWRAICADCAGSVGSIVELLQGKLSKHVMERVCREADGLFPAPKEIKLTCSCPDWADMCKHVAATLYGVGARLDHDPELLFALRGVDRSELVSTGAKLSITEAAINSERVLADNDLGALFGLQLEAPPPAPAQRKASAKAGASAKATRLPPSARKGGAAQAADEPAPRSAGKAGRAGGLAKARAATAAKGKRPPAQAPDAGAPSAEIAAKTSAKPKTANAVRRPGKSPLPKAEAKEPPRVVAAPEPAKSAPRSKPAESRTRAGKWIGAKARKAARP